MRKITRALTRSTAAALAVGMAGPALAAIQSPAAGAGAGAGSLDHQAGQALGRQVAVFTLRQLQTGHVHPG